MPHFLRAGHLGSSSPQAKQPAKPDAIIPQTKDNLEKNLKVNAQGSKLRLNYLYHLRSTLDQTQQPAQCSNQKINTLSQKPLYNISNEVYHP